jgi:hypothetical protein
MGKITPQAKRYQQNLEPNYSAVLSGKNKISVFNVDKGVISFNISLGSVEVVNGPVITRDKLTVVIRDQSGKTIGKVYSLKSGVLSYSFPISK